MRALLSTEKCENASFGQKKSMKWCIFWVPNLAKTLTCMELFAIVTYVLNSISKLRNCGFWQMETKHSDEPMFISGRKPSPGFLFVLQRRGDNGRVTAHFGHEPYLVRYWWMDSMLCKICRLKWDSWKMRSSGISRVGYCRSRICDIGARQRKGKCLEGE